MKAIELDPRPKSQPSELPEPSSESRNTGIGSEGDRSSDPSTKQKKWWKGYSCLLGCHFKDGELHAITLWTAQNLQGGMLSGAIQAVW